MCLQVDRLLIGIWQSRWWHILYWQMRKLFCSRCLSMNVQRNIHVTYHQHWSVIDKQMNRQDTESRWQRSNLYMWDSLAKGKRLSIRQIFQSIWLPTMRLTTRLRTRPLSTWLTNAGLWADQVVATITSVGCRLAKCCLWSWHTTMVWVAQTFTIWIKKKHWSGLITKYKVI